MNGYLKCNGNFLGTVVSVSHKDSDAGCRILKWFKFSLFSSLGEIPIASCRNISKCVLLDHIFIDRIEMAAKYKRTYEVQYMDIRLALIEHAK